MPSRHPRFQLLASIRETVERRNAMLTVRISEVTHDILGWDGQVLEHFGVDGSRRVHVGNIASIQVTTDRHGHHQLVGKTVLTNLAELIVDDKALTQTNELVAEVQKAIAANKI